MLLLQLLHLILWLLLHPMLLLLRRRGLNIGKGRAKPAATDEP